MSTATQAQTGKELKKLLLDRGLSVTGLARRIRKSRTAVSRAIHHGEFPLVQKLIAKELSRG